MEYEKLINTIINKIFDIDYEIQKPEFIKLYTQIYSIINCLDNEIFNDFENTISVNIKNILNKNYFNFIVDIESYIKYYEIFLDKAQKGDKIFHYFQNFNNKYNNGVISYLFNKLWCEVILNKIFPIFLDNQGSIENKNIEKIINYHNHLKSLNNQLQTIFINSLIRKISDCIVTNIEILINLIDYGINIKSIINEELYSIKIINIIKNKIDTNFEIVKEKLNWFFNDIKNKVMNNQLKINNIDTKYSLIFDFLDENKIEKYIKILEENLYINNIIDDESLNISFIIEYLEISSNLYKKIFNNFYNKSICMYYDYGKEKGKLLEIDLFLGSIISNVKERFNNDFIIEFIKYINKNKNEQSLLNNINIIINSLKNKEFFVAYYKKALRNRLLSSNIVNIADEITLLDILLNNNDLIDVTRMSVMCNDYHKSLIYSQEFNNLFNNNDFINLTTYDMWNLTPYDCEKNLLSTNFKVEMNKMKNNFRTYYSISNENKNIKYVDNISTCFIDFNNIELECNYLQADLLYLFNETNIIDLNEINIKENLVKSLTKPKILIKRNNKLIINNDFKYNKQTLKVYRLYKPETQKQNKNKDNSNNSLVLAKEDYINSFIMKYLKNNKFLDFEKNIIYTKTIDNFKSKFSITEKLFNNITDKLKENEYISIIDNKMKYLP